MIKSRSCFFKHADYIEFYAEKQTSRYIKESQVFKCPVTDNCLTFFKFSPERFIQPGIYNKVRILIKGNNRCRRDVTTQAKHSCEIRLVCNLPYPFYFFYSVYDAVLHIKDLVLCLEKDLFCIVPCPHWNHKNVSSQTVSGPFQSRTYTK